jgi:cytoskeleton protein RodZ
MSETEQPIQTPGEILRSARAAAGISAREMADRLNWMPSYIGAIEENRFEELRGTAFVRGYLRTYGKMLGVSEQSLLSAFDAMILPPESATANVPARPEHSVWRQPGVGIGLGISGALLVVLAFWWRQDAGQNPAVEQPQAAAVRELPPKLSPRPEQDAPPVETPQVDSPETDSSAVAVEEIIAIELTEGDSSTAEFKTEAAGTPAPEQESEQVVEQLPESTPATMEQPAAVVETLPPDATAFADAVLQFTFTGECWLEVLDGNNKLIYYNLRRAGDQLGVSGLPPFNIKVGNAANVKLVYRGEDFAITTRPGRTVARFDVGEP